MDTSGLVLILLGAFGLSHGAGLLPDDFTATAGGKVIFTTLSPPDSPFLVITWNFIDISGLNTNIIVSTSVNNTNAAYADRITLFKPTGALELRDLTVRDNGEYSVAIIPPAGATVNGRCKLQVLVPVSNVTVAATNTDLVELNDTVTLFCSATGSSLSFLWLNNSAEVAASDRVQITDGGAALTISSVGRCDQGPFKCLVTNAISNDTSDPVQLSINYGPENVHFTTSLSQEFIAKGSDLDLNCTANSKPSAEIGWLVNGVLQSYSGPQHTLQNIQMSDSGSYCCQAFNRKTLRSATSAVLSITVLEPVSNVQVISDTAEIWEFNSPTAQMSCSASGSSLSYTWFKGSAEVTVSDRVQLKDGNSTLTIINATRYDQGPFTCHAFNPVSGQTSDPLLLTAIFGPEKINLTVSPSQEFYDEGADVVVLCLTASGPPAFIQWFMNEDLLPHFGAELRLVNLQVSQSGNYSCQAYNNKTMRNETSQSASIYVMRSDIANVVITPGSTDLVEFNSSATLSCSCTGSFPSFQWFNGSSELTAGDRVHLADGGSSLTIINATRNDRGPYLCHAFNHFSNGTSDALLLSVSYGPENVNIQQFPPQQYHQGGANVTLSCMADSKPPAEMLWFVNGSMLSHTKAKLQLLNVNVNLSGAYSCQAFNNKTLRYAASPASTITVQEQIRTVEVASNISVLTEYSSSVSLSCFASGSSLSFLWLNDSVEVSASERVHFTDGGATLTVANVSRYDQGPFRCNVSNEVSSRLSQPVPLFIQHGPDRTMVVGPAAVRTGDFTALHCSADCVPSPQYSWCFNGDPSGIQSASYVIQSARGSDGGTYTCIAVNPATGRNQTATHELTVEDLSNCDSTAEVVRATLITAGTCLLVTIVCAISVFCIRKRKRLNTNYTAHLNAGKRNVQKVQPHSEIYRITRPEENDLYAVPIKKKRNEDEMAKTYF